LAASGQQACTQQGCTYVATFPSLSFCSSCPYIKSLYKHAGLSSVATNPAGLQHCLLQLLIDEGAVKTLRFAARFGMALALPGRATAIPPYFAFADKGVNVPEPGPDVHQCGRLLCLWGWPGAVGARPYGSCGVHGSPTLAYAAASPHAVFHQNLSPSA